MIIKVLGEILHFNKKYNRDPSGIYIVIEVKGNFSLSCPIAHPVKKDLKIYLSVESCILGL